MGLRAAAAELADLLLPRTCPGCGSTMPWCARCAKTLSRLHPVLPGEDFLDTWRRWQPGRALPAVRALARYQGPARAAVLAMKEKGRRDLARPLGIAIGAGIAGLCRIGALPPGPLTLVPAPSRRSAARRRGGDPVVAMAQSAARVLAAASRPATVLEILFTASSAADSVGLSTHQRLANLRHAVICRDWPIPARYCVLIDDVFTSGATVNCAAAALATRGHCLIAAVTVASVPPLAHLPARSRSAG